MMAPGRHRQLEGVAQRQRARHGGEVGRAADRKRAGERRDRRIPKGPWKGLRWGTLTDQAVQQLGLPANTKGVVVTDINPSSPVADSGLQQGDVIQEVNHQP